jgi:putative membrane protein
VKALFLTTATILYLCIVCLPLAISGPIESTPAGSVPGAALGPADTYFVSQTSLGTPFQIDSGRLAETKGTTQGIRDYAQLMVSSHITVNDALTAILKRKAPTPPPTLLKAAYSTIVSTLQHENGQTFDAEYVNGQVGYQRANAALYQYELANGTDPDLKAFAQQTLAKIQDHLERALKLQGGAE